MGKLILRKHQRALVQSFKKYQLDDMLAEEEALKKKKQQEDQLILMGDYDPILAMSGDFIVDTDNKLTDEQKKMLNEIRQKFDPVNVVADTCILYEVTDFKDESAAEDFWEQYMDFFELGGDEIIIKDERMDERALDREQRVLRQSSRL